MSASNNEQDLLDEIRSYLVNARKKSSILSHWMKRQEVKTDEPSLKFRYNTRAESLDTLSRTINDLIEGGVL